MHNVQGHSLLLAVDRHQSPLFEAFNRVVFTPYGVRSGQRSAQGKMGFNGQLRERESGAYLLGNGHRVYSPVLMRFHSADGLSPFNRGGVNAYAYCEGDPINFVDPSGRFLKSFFRMGKTSTEPEAALDAVVIHSPPASPGARATSSVPTAADVLETVGQVSANFNTTSTGLGGLFAAGAKEAPPVIDQIANFAAVSGSGFTLGGRAVGNTDLQMAGSFLMTAAFAIRLGRQIQQNGPLGMLEIYGRGAARLSGAEYVYNFYRNREVPFMPKF